MKKLYTTLALAATVAVSASAVSFTNQPRQDVKRFAVEKRALQAKAVELQAPVPATAKKAPQSRATESIEGAWVFTLGDYYSGENSIGEFTSNGTITLGTGSIRIDSDNNDFSSLSADYDESTGAITFKPISYGPVSISGATYYATAEPYIYNWSTEGLDYQNLKATYNASAGTITFPSDAGIAWIAYTDAACTQRAGYLDILDFVSAARAVEEPEPNWTAMGTATYLGCILEDSFIKDYDPSTMTPCELNIFYDANEPTTFKVEDPWKQLYATMGWNAESPAITLETADRSDVVVPLASTGINGGETDGLYGVMSYSFYSAIEGTSTPEASKIAMTVDANNVATITFPGTSMLLFASTSASVYYCTKNNSTLTFTLPSDINGALDKVEAGTDANAPVEFFNLQGMRVANPVAGQIVIKRQGSTVSKVVVR